MFSSNRHSYQCGTVACAVFIANLMKAPRISWLRSRNLTLRSYIRYMLASLTELVALLLIDFAEHIGTPQYRPMYVCQNARLGLGHGGPLRYEPFCRAQKCSLVADKVERRSLLLDNSTFDDGFAQTRRIRMQCSAREFSLIA